MRYTVSLLLLFSLALLSLSHAQSLPKVTGISAGWEHNCAVISYNGERYLACWGSNEWGELGDGTREDSPEPKLVLNPDGSPFKGVKAVSSSRYYNCALRVDGTVWCWGWNEGGKLGNGTYDGMRAFRGAFHGVPSQALTMLQSLIPYEIVEYSTHPVQVVTAEGEPLEDVVQITSASWHACALKRDSTLWCWGQNFDGALGNGKDMRKLRVSGPVDIAGLDWSYVFSPHAIPVIDLSTRDVLRDVKEVRGGSSDHTCVMMKDGRVRCWAWNGGEEGQLGIGDTTTTYVVAPTGPVVDESGEELRAKEIVTGGDFTCAITTKGEVKCWGVNSQGQLGTGDLKHRAVATPVIYRGSTLRAKHVFSERGNHVCAITHEAVLCWGDNSKGQLGVETVRGYSSVPLEVKFIKPEDVVKLAVGGGGRSPQYESVSYYDGDHTCALLRDGEVLCWGSNTRSQLGYSGDSSYEPVRVNFERVFKDLK